MLGYGFLGGGGTRRGVQGRMGVCAHTRTHTHTLCPQQLTPTPPEKALTSPGGHQCTPKSLLQLQPPARSAHPPLATARPSAAKNPTILPQKHLELRVPTRVARPPPGAGASTHVPPWGHCTHHGVGAGAVPHFSQNQYQLLPGACGCSALPREEGRWGGGGEKAAGFGVSGSKRAAGERGTIPAGWQGEPTPRSEGSGETEAHYRPPKNLAAPTGSIGALLLFGGVSAFSIPPLPDTRSWNRADGKEGTRRVRVGNAGKPGRDAGAFFPSPRGKAAGTGTINTQLLTGCRRDSCWRSPAGETRAENVRFWGKKSPYRIVLWVMDASPALGDVPARMMARW